MFLVHAGAERISLIRSLMRKLTRSFKWGQTCFLKPKAMGRHGRKRLLRSGVLLSMRSEEHTSELQSLMRISYAVFCLNKTNNNKQHPMMHNTDNIRTLIQHNPTLYYIITTQC